MFRNRKNKTLQNIRQKNSELNEDEDLNNNEISNINIKRRSIESFNSTGVNVEELNKIVDNLKSKDKNSNQIKDTTLFSSGSNLINSEKMIENIIDETFNSSKTLDDEDDNNETEKYSKTEWLDPMNFLKTKINDQKMENKNEDEGNLTFSASMLSSVPEVNLGIENKLNNIEATEKITKKINHGKHPYSRNNNNRRNNTASDSFALDKFKKRMKKL